MQTVSKRIKIDFYDLQKQIWRWIGSQRKHVAELIKPNQIPKKEWFNYLTELCKEEDTEELFKALEIITHGNIEIEPHDIHSALNKLKNRKNAGED